MQNHKYFVIAGAVAMLCQVPTWVHAATATLGVQADGDIRGVAPDTSFNRDYLAVINDDGTPSGAGKAYLRFQLPADFGTATDATFTIFRSATSVYGLRHGVFGLNDAVTGEATWTPNNGAPTAATDLTWNSAPGNDTSSPTNFVNATQVGAFTTNNSTGPGDSYTVSGASLISFLNADSNGLVTLMINQDPGDVTTSEDLFASASNSTYGVPSLQLTYTPLTPKWNSSGSGDWNNGSNWFRHYVPNGIGAEADFFSTGGIISHSTVFTDSAVTVGTLKFDNPNMYLLAGTGSLTLQVSTGSALVEILSPGTHEINLPLILASNTTFKTDGAGANLIIADPMTINSGITLTTNTSAGGTVSYLSTVTLQGGATFSLASSTSAHSLTMAAASTTTLSTTTGTKTVLQLDSLSLDSAASLNLTNNDLIVHQGDLATITNRLRTGFAGGAWNGVGINSSAAATSASHLTAVGVIKVTSASTVAGQSLQAGDVFARFTYYGDADLNGVINGNDYTLIDHGFTTTGVSGWQNGDFNYDGKIDGSDYALIDNAFNRQAGTISALNASSLSEVATSSAVPEPATLSLLAIGVGATLGRRRRAR